LSGHEDWIRSLAFKHPTTDDVPLVLASGSQDATIRLWNIERRKKILTNSAEDLVDELLDNFESSLGDLGENEEGGKQISLKHHIITVKAKSERFLDNLFLDSSDYD
jgi:elongator complex protein 2